MLAAHVTDYENPPHLVEVPDPVPAEGEVLVEVEAAGIHRVVRARAAGRHYSVSGAFPAVPGIDGVGRTPDGTRVWFFTMGSETNGSLAQKVAVDRALTVPVPESLDPVVVAASMNPLMAAWMSVFPRGELAEGDHLVVLGATGASGRATLEVARGTAGRATAVGRNEEVLEGLLAEGLATDAVVLGREDAQERFEEVARTAAVAVDFLWGPVAEQFWAAADRVHAPGRTLRHVEVGTMAGPDATVPGSLLRGGDLRLLGSAPGAYTQAELMAQMPGLLSKMAADGLSAPHRVFPLERFDEGWASTDAARSVIDLRG